MSSNGNENDPPMPVQRQAGSPFGSRPTRSDSLESVKSSLSDCSVSSDEGEPTITPSSAINHNPELGPHLSASSSAPPPPPPSKPLLPNNQTVLLRRSFIPVLKRDPKPPLTSSSIPVPASSGKTGQHLMKPPKSGLTHRSPKKRAMHGHLKSALRSTASDATDQAGSEQRRKHTKHRVRFQLT